MFRGSIAALPTPFMEDDRVDEESIAKLIEWHIEEGTDGIVLCGTTGEAPCLSHEEQIGIIRLGVNCSKGRIPIIAGTGSYNTRHTIAMTEEAQAAGADGCLVIFPYYNRPTPEGCFLHFQELNKVELPIIAYNHPGRTGIKPPVKTLAAIAELDSVVSIKDGSGDLDYILDFIQASDLPLLSSDDSLAVPILASGGAGVISIVANVIPRLWKQCLSLLLQGKIAEGRALYRQLYPIVKAMVLETNPQCVKYALSVMGKCRASMRLPLIEPQPAAKEKIAEALIPIQLEKLGV
ncbi:MAG: 4-hydroxy-tetrahydrodipicolinate synthase [Verrucomicrobia bacterium]|nr:4-hydroxy-tetrahydrodipicolinate synthase [Verrucomicrobiota bacterium]